MTSMSLAKEFKEFIARGNVIDLAVGVIIGAAFGKIVTALVDGIIMPPVGLIAGRVDFSQLKIVLQAKDAAKNQAEVAILYGSFLNTVISFLIVSACVFLLVKGINRLKREEAARPVPSPEPPRTEKLLEEIRDVLKAK
jgi:large conductance mechanosensitive channel